MTGRIKYDKHFTGSIIRCIWRFITDFKGCSGRLEYGLTCLFVLIFLPAFILWAGGAHSLISEWTQHTRDAFSSQNGLAFNMILALSILSIAPIISFLVILLLFPLLGVQMGILLNPQTAHWLRLPLVMLFAVMGAPFLISYTAVTVRRLHDINKSRLLAFISWVPLINVFLLFLLCGAKSEKKSCS